MQKARLASGLYATSRTLGASAQSKDTRSCVSMQFRNRNLLASLPSTLHPSNRKHTAVVPERKSRRPRPSNSKRPNRNKQTIPRALNRLKIEGSILVVGKQMYCENLEDHMADYKRSRRIMCYPMSSVIIAPEGSTFDMETANLKASKPNSRKRGNGTSHA